MKISEKTQDKLGWLLGVFLLARRSYMFQHATRQRPPSSCSCSLAPSSCGLQNSTIQSING